MNDVYLLLGSNLGNRQLFLKKALALIENDLAPVSKISSIYETQSWGKADAPDYLNQVIVLQTALPAQKVLEKILAIEMKLGRRREEKWGSRTIDIDILFYGQEIIDENELHVPHPELHNRRFTLEPLVEIAPDFVHPVLNKSVSQLTNALKDSLLVKRYNFNYKPGMSNLDGDLDLSLLYEIADGSNEFIVESIDMFLVDVPGLVGSMEQAVADHNWADLSSSAHKLKSSLGFFGMATSQSLMQNIELEAKASTPDTSVLSSKFNEVREILDANMVTLTKIKSELGE